MEVETRLSYCALCSDNNENSRVLAAAVLGATLQPTCAVAHTQSYNPTHSHTTHTHTQFLTQILVLFLEHTSFCLHIIQLN